MTLWPRVKPLVLGCVGAAVGVALVVGYLHWRNDHALLHQVVMYLNQQAAAAKR